LSNLGIFLYVVKIKFLSTSPNLLLPNTGNPGLHVVMAGRSGEPKPIIRRGSNFIVIIRFLGKSPHLYLLPRKQVTTENKEMFTHNLPKHKT